MGISELSAASGVSVATIKYYVRDGLLAEGARTGYNRTDYAESHLARLRLIRALTQAGGLSIAATRAVLASIDDPELDLEAVLATAQRALPTPDEPPSPAAVSRVWELVRERGWQAQDTNPGIAQVAHALDAYQDIGRSDLTTVLPGYADAADAAARLDIDLVAAAPDRDSVAGTVVVGTVLGDRLLAGLRRIAQESASRERYGALVHADDAPDPAATLGGDVR